MNISVFAVFLGRQASQKVILTKIRELDSRKKLKTMSLSMGLSHNFRFRDRILPVRKIA